MKLLNYFEKSQAIFLLIASLLFFFLRFPSLFEPYWYGDEGIYFVIGDALRDGRVLYEGIWDNKPPLLYFFYQFFGKSIFEIKLLSLIFGIGTMIAFYSLTNIVFRSIRYAALSTLIFLFFFATPIIEGNIANAENFMLLPILIGFLLFFKVIPLHQVESVKNLSVSQKRILIISGVFFGSAFLFKTVGLFDFLALLFFIFLTILHNINPNSNKSILGYFHKKIFYFYSLIAGFFIPILIYGIVAIFQGNLLSFIQSAFFSNVTYVRIENYLLIPQGFLLLKTVVLGVLLFGLFKFRNKLPNQLLFLLTWFVFSLYSIFFSQRPYGHYILLLIPTYILLIFSAFSFPKFKKQLLLSSIVIFFLIMSNFNFFLAPKTLSYYVNFASFLSGQRSTSAYLSYFDHQTERDYALSSFIKTLPAGKDDVFIWGDSAQIYFMTNKLPIGKYAVSYHVTSKEAKDEVNKSNVRIMPRYIITLPNTALVPFSLKPYNYRVTIEGASIYERIN